MSKIKYPKGECVWVSYYSEGQLKLILTSKEGNRDFYFLYELVDGEFRKLGKSRSPFELEEKYKISERLRE